MALEWHSALSVGHALLDAQHRKLLRAYGDFIDQTGADRQDFHERFNDFVDLLLDHFRTEEDILARSGFPHLGEHRKLHQVMIEDISDILLETTRGKVNAGAAAARVADWIGTHLGEDLKYKPFVQAY